MTRPHQSCWLPHGHLTIEEMSICDTVRLSAIGLIHRTLLLPIDLRDFFFASCQEFFFVRILRDFDCLTKRWVGAEFKNWILDTMRWFLRATSWLASSRAVCDVWCDWQFERIKTFPRRARFLGYTLNDTLPVKLVNSLSIFIKALTFLWHIWSNWYRYGSYIFICFSIILSRHLRLLHTSMVSSLPDVGFLVCCLKIINAFEKADYFRLLGKL